MLAERARNIEVVGEAGDGFTAIEMDNSLHPDVVLLDIFMPGMNGVEVVRMIREQGLAVHILILSGYVEEALIHELFSYGIEGYLLKDEVNARIVDAIQGITRGEPGWISPSIAAQLQDRYAWEHRPAAILSGREKEVLERIISGKTNQEIAKELGIGKKTVEKHLANIFRKLEVSSRVEAAVNVLRNKRMKG